MENDKYSNGWLSTLFFMSAYLPLLVVSFFNTTMYRDLMPSALTKGVIFYAFLILFFKFLLLDKHTFKEYTIYVIIELLVLISYMQAGSNTFFVFITILLLSSDIDEDTIVRGYLLTSLLLLLFTFFSTKMGWIEDLVYTRGTLLRHSFGVIYTTDFAAHVFYICCAYVFLRFKHYSVYDMLLLIFVASLVYRWTDARLNTVMIILLAITSFTTKKGYVNWIIKKLWLLVPIPALMFSYVTTAFFNSNSKLLTLLNSLFSGRLSIVQEILNLYGIKAFGQKVIENGWGGSGFNLMTAITPYSYIDAAYMKMLIVYGLIPTLMFLFGLTTMIKEISSKKLILIVGLILISGLIEEHLFDIAYNPFFIILVSEYFKEIRVPKKLLFNGCVIQNIDEG